MSPKINNVWSKVYEVIKYSFGHVRRERLENGWTQKELANKLGVKQSVIAKWERDGAVYRKATRNKLAAVFGIGEESFR